MPTVRVQQKPKVQGARKVIIGGQSMHIAQSPLQPKDESLSIQSKYLPSKVALESIDRSVKVVPVLIFIPAPSVGEQALLDRVLGEGSLAYIDGRKLTGVLKDGDVVPRASDEEATICFGEVAVDFLKMEVFRKNDPVALTTLQFRALRYLTRHARRVISRDELLNEVWGYEYYPTTRTVDNAILKLRQKLERDPSRPVHFRTIHGTGYKFSP